MNTITLYCQAGKHDWERESKRGKRPHNCPEHQPAKPEATTKAAKNANGTVTLHCQLGNHSWERPSQKGARPRNCPDHQPVVEPVGERIAQAKASKTATIDPEAVAALRAKFGVSERVATAYALAKVEPRYQWQIDENGFSSADNLILDKVATDTFNEDDFEPVI